jgi:uncharacterized membrane protein
MPILRARRRTGAGEMTIRCCTACSIVLHMKQAASVADAVGEAVDDMRALKGGLISRVTIHVDTQPSGRGMAPAKQILAVEGQQSTSGGGGPVVINTAGTRSTSMSRYKPVTVNGLFWRIGPDIRLAHQSRRRHIRRRDDLSRVHHPASGRGRGTDGGLAGKLTALLPQFLTLALSFFFSARCWVLHYRMHSVIVRGDECLLVLNLCFLFGIILVPFSADVLGNFPLSALSVTIYAANGTFIASMIVAIWGYALVHPHILHTEDARRLGRYLTLGISVMFGFLVHRRGSSAHGSRPLARTAAARARPEPVAIAATHARGIHH